MMHPSQIGKPYPTVEIIVNARHYLVRWQTLPAAGRRAYLEADGERYGLRVESPELGRYGAFDTAGRFVGFVLIVGDTVEPWTEATPENN